MDCSGLNGTRDTDLKGPDVQFYFEDSESELEFSFNPQAYSSKKTQRNPWERSPPLVLAFPLSTGPGDSGKSLTSDLDQITDEDLERDSPDEPVEDWMVLGGAAQEGDGDIQLNVGYWRGSSSDGSDVECPKSDEHSWAVLERDKSGTDRPVLRYYSAPKRAVTCRQCNQRGHLARACPRHKRRAACSLCGMQGHRHRSCPRRHCPSCSLPPHGHAPCPQRPVWDQHCLRCGMSGHLADACPDTWRQFHSTVSAEAPLKPEMGCASQDTVLSAHCYNCSRSGHYGYECVKRRMRSGTFPSVPYVCRYDVGGEGGQPSAREQRRARELRDTLSLPLSEHLHYGKPTRVGESHHRPAQSRAAPGRRERLRGQPRESRRVKAERQQERQELKKLRRQTEARREGGPHGAGRAGLGGDGRKPPSHQRQVPPPHLPLKRRRQGEEEGCGVKAVEGARSRKSREAERWKKRRGMRRGFLFPHGDLGATDENLLSPKNQARQRKR
ncbi:zinc finger CCHC domain-containing protein 7-like [Gadus chalcogrammus]|uniref:zinc finger CCHC domain-containing protein 7-like n=1 Tax=Gadus chalcogrammus TaxID=1042646 RepID=UPI0024C47D30|nr:zinc finger CCHC domain-containing protein 7-like [Gadus chalcogrammus]